MSSDALASEVQAITTSYYLGISACAIYLLDYILTFEQEVLHIWLKPKTGVSVLFMLNRYVAFTDAIMLVTPTPDFQSCVITTKLFYFTALTQYLIFATFSALRVYSLWHRNLWLGGIVFALTALPFMANLYIDITSNLTFIPGLNLCDSTIKLSGQKVLACRLAVIFADILVLCATWHKTYRLYRDAQFAGAQVYLPHLLIRDGTLYFLALLAMNILVILNDNIPAFAVLSSASTFIAILTPVLINRFLLNLRGLKKGGPESARSTQYTSIAFNIPDTVTGNMGDDLHVDDEDDMESSAELPSAAADPTLDKPNAEQPDQGL